MLRKLKTSPGSAEGHKKDAGEGTPSDHRCHPGDDHDHADEPDKRCCGAAREQGGEKLGGRRTSSLLSRRLCRSSIPLSRHGQPPAWRTGCTEYPQPLRRMDGSSARQCLRPFSEPVLQACHTLGVKVAPCEEAHTVLRHRVLVSGLIAQVNAPSDVVRVVRRRGVDEPVIEEDGCSNLDGQRTGRGS